MKPDRNVPKLVDARTVTMPCPVCGHPQNDSRWQEAAHGKSAKSEPKEGPTSVPCLLCGAAIRVVVPFHVLCAMPAGWRWERTIDERARVKEYVHARLVDLVNAGASDDRVGAIGPTQAFFKALNAMTVAEVEEVFQHPLVLTCWGSEHGNGIQLAYAKYVWLDWPSFRDNSPEECNIRYVAETRTQHALYMVVNKLGGGS